MNSEAITQIILAVIGLLSVLATSVLVPYIRSKTTKEQRDDIEYWTGVAIQAIEQYYVNNPKQGEAKKQYVMDFVMSHGYKVTEQQMDVLIDALVEDLINQPREELMLKTAFLTD